MQRSTRDQTVRRRTTKTRPELKLFAPTAAGLEQVLVTELKRIGAFEPTPVTRGVSFWGNWEMVYKANLWLRTAHRVLWQIAEFPAKGREALYEGVRAIPWNDFMTVDQTVAMDGVSHRSELDHTQFIARVVKDGVVDYWRDHKGRRPNVDPAGADLRINARLHEDHCTLSIDTSGERLHRRGYRPFSKAAAPLQETLAAGIVLLSGYDGHSPFVDPMCGSGTLLIEAALIAKNQAPGLMRSEFGFMKHRTFNRTLWLDALHDAKAAVIEPDEAPIFGCDISADAVRAATAGVLGAGVDDLVRLRRSPITELQPRGEGFVVTNPPYGHRLGDEKALGELYREIGDTLKWRCRGMTGHVFTGSKELAKQIGLKTSHRDTLWNGPIECRLLHYDLY